MVFLAFFGFWGVFLLLVAGKWVLKVSVPNPCKFEDPNPCKFKQIRGAIENPRPSPYSWPEGIFKRKGGGARHVLKAPRCWNSIRPSPSSSYTPRKVFAGMGGGVGGVYPKNLLRLFLRNNLARLKITSEAKNNPKRLFLTLF